MDEAKCNERMANVNEKIEVNTKRLDNYSGRLKSTEQEITSINIKVDNLIKHQEITEGMQKSILSLTDNMTKMVTQLKYTEKTLDGISKDLEEIKSLPKKNLNSWMMGALGALTGAILMYFFNLLIK